MKKEVTAQKKVDDNYLHAPVSGKSENRDQVHELKDDCNLDPSYQSGYQRYGSQFKPKISAASSTFSQNKINITAGKRVSP